MRNNETTLYAKDSRNNIRQWTIWSEDQYIYMDYGVLGGESITDHEHVPCGLSTRTIEEQIESRINSRVNKKKDSGYVCSIEEAKSEKRTNSLGYKMSSKCMPWNKAKKDFRYEMTYLQTKLDGHHCSIVNDDGVKIAYSSSGKIIDTIPEIVNSIDVPNGRTIEGELYHHGTPLQTISSWVKKRQKETLNLKFVVYEIDIPFIGYGERIEHLKRLKINDSRFVKIHKTDLLIGRFNVLTLIKQEVERGYEGLVLRPHDEPYTEGKRNRGAIKVKPIHFKGEFAIDDEFLVVDILSSKDGYARLKCETEDGKVFFVLCHGTNEYKAHVYKNKHDYTLKHIEIEFAGYSKSKIPLHGVAKRWREKFDE